MSKTFFPILALALSLALAGCATTGDPKAGGLFGWSESKAKDRQAEARAALEREEKRSAELKAEKGRLQNQINAKQKELDALKKKSSASSDGLNPAEQAEIRRLEQELAQLRKEVQKKEEEALVLMDL